jgi:hypothetical protein
MLRQGRTTPVTRTRRCWRPVRIFGIIGIPMLWRLRLASIRIVIAFSTCSLKRRIALMLVVIASRRRRRAQSRLWLRRWASTDVGRRHVVQRLAIRPNILYFSDSFGRRSHLKDHKNELDRCLCL